MLFDGIFQVMVYVSVSPLPLQIHEFCLQKEAILTTFIPC